MSDRPSLRDDPVWRQILDWRRRLDAAPGDAALRARHARWLAEDPAHAEAQARLEKVWLLTGSLPAATVVPLRRRRPSRLAAAVLAVAACLALVLMPRLGADHRTATGEIQRLALADGSFIHLDGASAVDVALGDGGRAVTLRQGQAFFEVTRDPGRPFTVTAGAVRVTVIGTAFDVRRGDDGVSVSVRSGAVRVAAGGTEVLLAPGDRLAVGSNGGWKRDRVDPALVASWRDGRLVAEGATIAEVVEELRRHHSGMIVLNDGDLAQRRVFGIYDLSDPLAALRAAVHPHGGTVRDWPLLAMVEKK